MRSVLPGWAFGCGPAELRATRHRGDAASSGHIKGMNSNNRRPSTGMARRTRDMNSDELLTVDRFAVTLPEREVHMYDEAGFLACDDDYRLQVLANVADYARLIESGLTTEQVGSKLHVDVAAVRKRIDERTLWAIKDNGRWLLPALQFDEDGVIPGMDRIIRLVSVGMHPLSVCGLLTGPSPELSPGGAPVSLVEWLRAGGDITLAVPVVQHGIWAAA